MTGTERLKSGLFRYDREKIPDDETELRLFMVVRNEAIRLPYLLSYYEQRGVDRFFVVDNGSTDETRHLLDAHPRTHVFGTDESFDVGQSGRHWLLPLLSRYGRHHWCVVADADEMLCYPGWEQSSIPDITNFLGQVGSNGLYCHLLDMYSDKPINETTYVPGNNPLISCPYFDSEYEAVPGVFYDRPENREYSINTHVGGMRTRVFGIKPYCSKVPLFRYDKSLIPARGCHDLIGLRSSGLQGAVLHFKYLFDFTTRVREEASRPERINVAGEYAAYVETLARDPSLNLNHSGSHRFRDSEQLVVLGVMNATPDFRHYLAGER